MTDTFTALYTPRGPTIGTAKEQERATDLRVLLSRSAKSRGFTLETLRGKSRMRAHCDARVRAAVEAYHAGYNLSEIGRAMGKDHTTILGMVRKHDARVAAALDAAGTRVEAEERENGARLTIDLSAGDAIALFRIASARGEPAGNMLSNAVRHIIADDLFAAILDR
jgi:hypothetical protein